MSKHLVYCDKILKKQKLLTDDERQTILLRLSQSRYESMSEEELSKIIQTSQKNIIKDRVLTRHYKHFASKVIDNEDVFAFIVDNNTNKYEALYEALDKLSEDDKELILRKYFDAFTFDELASEMNLTKGQMRYKINQILFELYSELKKAEL
jgi:DNA-directed RNA polymerase specialized sigma24 family protein